MSRLTLGQKADRVLKLLLGMRNARVVSALTTRGFGQDDLEEGWSLLRNVAKGHFDYLPTENTDPSVIAELDLWENTWFPIVSASLSRRFPKVAERVFLNLSQTEGPGVVLSVGTFIERIDEVAKATDEDSRQAMALLTRRGLTEQVLSQAKTLLVAVKQTVGVVPLDPATQREEYARAEQALWDWYLEWSQIARSTITERQLLRSLGFLNVARGVSDEEDATCWQTSRSAQI